MNNKVIRLFAQATPLHGAIRHEKRGSCPFFHRDMFLNQLKPPGSGTRFMVGN
jgi:hypothetical protein